MRRIRILIRNLGLMLRHGRQWWYWTPAWQEAEREADENYRAGRFTTYSTVDAFIADLEGGELNG